MRLVKLNIVIAAYNSCSAKQSLLPCRFTSPIVYFKSRKLDSIPQRKCLWQRGGYRLKHTSIQLEPDNPQTHGIGAGKIPTSPACLAPLLALFRHLQKDMFFCLSSFVCVVLTVKWISVSSFNIGRRATSLIAE